MQPQKGEQIMKRVVITGMAPLCPLGYSHEELFENLCERKRITVDIDKNNECRKKLRATKIVPYPELDDGNFTEETLMVKARGSTSAYAAVKASLGALKDAGLEKADDDAMVFIGSDSFSMKEFTEDITRYEREQRMNIMVVPITMQSSVDSWVTIVLGTHGRSSILNMACASATTAIGWGYDNIRAGRCKMALCGGSNCITDKNLMMNKGFEYLKCSTTDSEGNSYPFSEERNGFLFSEGGTCMLVLEELESALARKAEIYAEITGFESTSDAYSILSMRPDGDIIEGMLRKLIGDKKIDYYNAHGTATLLNDEVERKVLKNIFGYKSKQPAISATKAFMGHTLAASGAFEAAVCVDSIRHNKVHGNLLATPFDDINITAETREMQVDTAISASFGFGGFNSALLIERYRE